MGKSSSKSSSKTSPAKTKSKTNSRTKSKTKSKTNSKSSSKTSPVKAKTSPVKAKTSPVKAKTSPVKGSGKINDESIKNVLLDLDQTLISSEATEDLDFKTNRDKMKKFRFHNMDDYYIVFERPGLQEFLTYLFDNFNVSVWTAASKDYALFVIDKAVIANNSNRKLDYVFFSYHCDISEKISAKQGTKDLNVLWDNFKLDGYNKDNTVIIDDYKEDVHKIQPNNCILAKPIEFTSDDSPKDDFLKRLTELLKEEKLNPTSRVVQLCNSKLV